MKDGQKISLNVLGRIEVSGIAEPGEKTVVRRSFGPLLACLVEPHVRIALGQQCPLFVSRDRLCAEFAEGKKGSFRAYLSDLGKYLASLGADEGVLVKKPGFLAISLDMVDCDALRFISCCRDNTPKSLLDAFNLYRGPFAPDLEAQSDLPDLLEKMFESCRLELLTHSSPPAIDRNSGNHDLYYSPQRNPWQQQEAGPAVGPDVATKISEIVGIVNSFQTTEDVIAELQKLYLRNYKCGDYARTVQAYEQAAKLLQKDRRPEIIAKLYIDASGIALRGGNIPEAAIYLHQASIIPRQKGDVDMRDRLEMAYGHVEYQRGNTKKASVRYKAAYRIVEKRKKPQQLAEIALSVVAAFSAEVDLHLNSGKRQKALDCLEEAEIYWPDLEQAMTTKGTLAIRANTTAGIFVRQKALVSSDPSQKVKREIEAEDYFLCGLGLAEEASDHMFVAIYRNDLACIYYDRHEYRRATDDWEKALQIFREYESLRLCGVAQVNLGCSYFKLKRCDAACEAFVDAIHLYFQSGCQKDVDLEALFWIAQMFTEAHAHSQAQKINSLRESVVSAMNERYIVQVVREVFNEISPALLQA